MSPAMRNAYGNSVAKQTLDGDLDNLFGTKGLGQAPELVLSDMKFPVGAQPITRAPSTGPSLTK